MGDTTYNPEQMSTIDEAKTLVEQLAKFDIATGVSPIDDTDDYHNEKSGVYLPPWDNSTGANPEPAIGDARQFLLRYEPTPEGFRPGGFNVGMIRDLMAKRGYSLDYVAGRHEAEVQAQLDTFKASLG